MKAFWILLSLVVATGCTVPSSGYHAVRITNRHWAAVLPDRHFVQVTFDSVPSGGSVEVGDFYVGTGRMSRPLQHLQRFRIRITKPGFQPWTGTIIAEDGLVVAPELTPIPPPPNGGLIP